MEANLSSDDISSDEETKETECESEGEQIEKGCGDSTAAESGE